MKILFIRQYFDKFSALLPCKINIFNIFNMVFFRFYVLRILKYDGKSCNFALILSSFSSCSGSGSFILSRFFGSMGFIAPAWFYNRHSDYSNNFTPIDISVAKATKASSKHPSVFVESNRFALLWIHETNLDQFWIFSILLFLRAVLVP